MNDKEIIKQSIAILGGIKNCNVKIKGKNIRRVKKSSNNVIFLDSSFEVQYNNYFEIFDVEVKKVLTPDRVGYEVERAAEIKNRLLIVGEYISPTACKNLRKYNISYVELSGNLCLQAQQFYIQVLGNKSLRTNISRSNNYRVSAKMKLVLASILKDPTILDNSYSTVSYKLNISKGGLSDIYKKLITMEFLKRDKDKKLIIEDKMRKDFYDFIQRELDEKLLTKYGSNIYNEKD